MRAVWRYIRVKANRELLAFICGGLAAVVTGGWIAYTHFSKKEPPDKPRIAISAEGGVAAGTITSSPITVNSQALSAVPGNPAARR